MNKQQTTILVVDDEKTIREVVRRYLEIEGYNVLEAGDGIKALSLLKHESIHLIVLDIMLPGLDGFSVTKKLRNYEEYTVLQQSHTDIPIIFLTARSNEQDRINGFELGADDYMIKPFSPRELVVRVKAVLRRTSTNSQHHENPITVNDFYLDPRSRTFRIQAESIALTAKEFDLLWFLARHPAQVFSRQQLLDNVWGYEFYGDESTVTVHVRRLREKIEKNPANPIYIQTVWGIGYKFEVPKT